MNKLPAGRFAFPVQFAAAPGNVKSLVAAVTAEIAKIQNGQIDDKDIGKIKEARLSGIEDSFKNNAYWLSSISADLHQGISILTPEEARASTPSTKPICKKRRKNT